LAAHAMGYLQLPRLAPQDLILSFGGVDLDDMNDTLRALGVTDGAKLHLSIDEDAMGTRLHAEYVVSLQGDLCGAVKREDRRAVQALLETDEVIMSQVTSAMQAAVQTQNIELLQLLLESRSSYVNTPGTNGFTAVHIAAELNCVEALRVLLSKGGDANMAARCANLWRNGATPVHIASMNNSADALKVLVEHGAAVNSKLSNGATPLFVAKYLNNAEAAMILEQRDGKIQPPFFILRCVAAVPVGIIVAPLLFLWGGLGMCARNNRFVLNNTVGRVIGRSVLRGPTYDNHDGSIRVY